MSWPSRVEDVAEAFWAKAGGRDRYGTPPDLEFALSVVLRAAVVYIPSLDTSAVGAFLDRIGALPWQDTSPRPLRGCMVADAGVGVILVNEDDPADERRVTVAHELAHLLLHYLRPRERAESAFGGRIAAVLDRLREATAGEKMSSAIRAVPIEPYRHAMERGTSLDPRVLSMESEADDLAIEILAPFRHVEAMRDRSPGAIRERFGVTAPVAVRLCAVAARPRTSVGVMGMFSPRKG